MTYNFVRKLTKWFFFFFFSAFRFQSWKCRSGQSDCCSRQPASSLRPMANYANGTHVVKASAVHSKNTDRHVTRVVKCGCKHRDQWHMCVISRKLKRFCLQILTLPRSKRICVYFYSYYFQLCFYWITSDFSRILYKTEIKIWYSK